MEVVLEYHNLGGFDLVEDHVVMTVEWELAWFWEFWLWVVVVTQNYIDQVLD